MDSDRPDILALEEALTAAERDARTLVDGLSEGAGSTWRPPTGGWTVAECLDHLAAANRVYVEAMRPSAEAARARGSRRRGPALPGLFGGWFVRTMEPPVKPRFGMRAPKKIVPRQGPALTDATRAFLASQDEVRAFLRAYADIDLASVTFPNPFVRGIRFSLATGLHVITSHERRHLWQAWRVRRAAEGTPGS